jgi:hypothetical protein
MANEMTLFKDGNQLPSYLKNREMDDVTKSLMGGGSLAKRISIKGGVWRLMSGGKEIAVNEDRAMNFIIVNAAPKVGRTYYAGTYDPDAEKAAAPVCWSANGDTPDSSVTDPQAKTCATCPQNIKGSGQGDSRACRFSQRVAVVLENDLGGDVFQLSLPAASIFGNGEGGKLPLNAYVKFLAGFNVPVTAVVTEARFDTNAATPKLTFKAARALTEAEFKQCEAAGQSAAAKQAVTFTVSQQDGVKQIEKRDEEFRSNDKPAPKKAVEPEVEPEGEAEPGAATPPAEEAPTKRTTKAAPPAPKKDAKALLDEWDD